VWSDARGVALDRATLRRARPERAICKTLDPAR
jgi:hypothetical protein